MLIIEEDCGMTTTEIIGHIRTLYKLEDTTESGSFDVLTKTAYHEAGHAVMAFVLKGKFKCIGIQDKAGEIKGGFAHYDQLKTDHHIFEDYVQSFMMSLSGLIAELKIAPPDERTYTEGCAKDLENFHDHLMHCLKTNKRPSFGDYPTSIMNKEEESMFLSWIYLRTKNVLCQKKNWTKVEALAENLKSKRLIKFHEVLHILIDPVDCEKCKDNNRYCEFIDFIK